MTSGCAINCTPNPDYDSLACINTYNNNTSRNMSVKNQILTKTQNNISTNLTGVMVPTGCPFRCGVSRR